MNAHRRTGEWAMALAFPALLATGAVPAWADRASPSAVVARPVAPTPWKKAAPRKSNGSGVGVLFLLESTPTVGQPVVVRLSFDGIRDVAGATVRLSVDPGLSLPSGATDLVSLPTGEQRTLTVEVTPGAEGLAYLNVFTTQSGVSSATSIPIQVGPDSVAAIGAERAVLKPSSSGADKVRSLPVR